MRSTNRLRRSVRDESLRQLPRNEPGSRRVTSQDVDDLDAVLFTAPGGNPAGQNDLLLAIVKRRVELKLSNPVDVVDRPAVNARATAMTSSCV
jgi:hypothetical protein